MPLAEQFYAFMVTVIIGLVVGFGYDFYLVLRRRLRLRKIGTSIGDLLFWVVTTAVVFGLLLLGNRGEIRFYVFLGLGLGLAVYLKLLSQSAVAVLQTGLTGVQKLWHITKTIVVFLWQAILFPINITVMVLCFPFQLLARLFSGIVSGCGKILTRLLSRPARAVKGRLRNLKRIFKSKPKQ